MSVLHTVNKSPFDRPAVDSCVNHALPGSAILLIEDGVYAARAGTRCEALLSSVDGVKVYALGPDLRARGIAEDSLVAGVEVVGYDGFVELAAAHDKVQSWL